MTDQPTPVPVWQDGDPTMEAIAAAVWEHCEKSDGSGIVIDDPRNIAAAAVAGIRDAARTAAGRPAGPLTHAAAADAATWAIAHEKAAARQTTGQDDTWPAPWTADDRHGPTPDETRKAIAHAIHRYDNQHALSGNDMPSEHHYGEADAVLAALAAVQPDPTTAVESQDHPGADLYVRLRKAGEDHDTAQALIYAHARMAVREHVAIHGEAPAVGQPAEAPQPRANRATRRAARRAARRKDNR